MGPKIDNERIAILPEGMGWTYSYPTEFSAIRFDEDFAFQQWTVREYRIDPEVEEETEDGPQKRYVRERFEWRLIGKKNPEASGCGICGFFVGILFTGAFALLIMILSKISPL